MQDAARALGDEFLGEQLHAQLLLIQIILPNLPPDLEMQGGQSQGLGHSAGAEQQASGMEKVSKPLKFVTQVVLSLLCVTKPLKK